MKRYIVFGTCAVLAAAVVCAVPVCAYDDVEEIELTVGYWGGTEYTKDTIIVDDMWDTFDVHQEIYTWIDNSASCGTTEAEGVYLSDIMDYYDIDMDSVYYYNFETLDASSYAGATVQWTADKLFGTRYTLRYVFERAANEFSSVDLDYFNSNIADFYTVYDFFNMADSRDEAAYLDEAWEEREEIEPMLILSSYSTRWTTVYPSTLLDFSNVSTEQMPQLIYGLDAKDDVGRATMGKMVCGIHIWFYGSPSILADYYDIDKEVGTTVSLNIRVSTPDTYLSSMIAEEITYTSSNTNVAEVDENGNVTIVGEGTARVKVKYDGSTIHTVNVTGTAADDGTGDGTGDGSGDDDGDGSGDEDGDGSGDGDENSDGEGSGDGDGSGGDGDSEIGDDDSESGDDDGGDSESSDDDGEEDDTADQDSGGDEEGESDDASGDSDDDREDEDTNEDENSGDSSSVISDLKEQISALLDQIRDLLAGDSDGSDTDASAQTKQTAEDVTQDQDTETTEDTEQETQTAAADDSSSSGQDASGTGGGSDQEEEESEELTEQDEQDEQEEQEEQAEQIEEETISAQMYELDTDTEYLPESEDSSLPVGILVLVLFGAGAAGEGIYYKRQSGGKDRDEKQ